MHPVDDYLQREMALYGHHLDCFARGQDIRAPEVGRHHYRCVHCALKLTAYVWPRGEIAISHSGELREVCAGVHQ